MSQPLVTVIVPTINRPDWVVDAIRSIQGQKYQSTEVIVVNDAGISIEGTIDLFNRKRNNIIYLKQNKNKGLAAARNIALRLATGKYVAFLDDDDVYYADHLETLVQYLEANPERVAYTDAYRHHQGYGDGWRQVSKKKDLPYSVDFSKHRMAGGNYIPVCCLMFEKSCFDEMGFFDETLGAHEDWEMWTRMCQKIHPWKHIKKTTCEFSWRGDTMTFARADVMNRTRAEVAKRNKKYL